MAVGGLSTGLHWREAGGGDGAKLALPAAAQFGLEGFIGKLAEGDSFAGGLDFRGQVHSVGDQDHAACLGYRFHNANFIKMLMIMQKRKKRGG